MTINLDTKVFLLWEQKSKQTCDFIVLSLEVGKKKKRKRPRNGLCFVQLTWLKEKKTNKRNKNVFGCGGAVGRIYNSSINKGLNGVGGWKSEKKIIIIKKYILWTCVCVRALHEEKGKKENENGRKE